MKQTSKEELKFETKQQAGLNKINKLLQQSFNVELDKENQDPNTNYNCSTPIKELKLQNQDTIIKKIKNDKICYLSPNSNYSPSVVKATKSDQSILLKVEVPGDEKKEFQVIISNDRPDTNLSNHKQGNHVSAYITFIHLLISAVECENAQEVSTRISETLKNIIPSQESSNKELSAFNEQKLSTFTSRDSRKEKTACFRVGMQLMQYTQEKIEKEVTELKNSIKSNNNYIIADIMENAGNMLLKCLNQDDYMAIEKTVKGSNGGEGPAVRSAINCLKTVDRIIYINNAKNDKEYKGLVENFIEDYYQSGSSLKSGLKRIMCTDDSISGFNISKDIQSKFDDLRENLKNPENLEIILESKNLFKNLLFNDNSREVHQTNICKSVSNLFDFKYSENQALANVEPILYKVTARHLAIIFNAFPSLKSLDNKNNGIIKNSFLEFVLENQGWSGFSRGINDKFTPLNLEYFNKKIENYLDLKEYNMKPIDKKEDNKEMDYFPQLVLIKQDVAKNHIGNPIFGNTNFNNMSPNLTIKE